MRSDSNQIADCGEWPPGPDSECDNHQMNEYRQPEDKTKADFQRLMPEQPLCQMSTRPAPQDAEQVQCFLGNARQILGGTTFINTIQNECDAAAGDRQ